MRWETHCHTVYSNRRPRRFDALNTPQEMIEAALRKGLSGLIITDHDTVRGGLVGRKLARAYPGVTVIPGVEVTSASGHVLAMGVYEDVPKGLGVGETVEKIHDFGGVAVASHPFSTRVKNSVKDECSRADAIEVFNASNRANADQKARFIAEKLAKPQTAGSDAHWARTVGNAGIICDDPVEDLRRGRVRIFGKYTSAWDTAMFNFHQLLSDIAGRPIM